MDANWSTLTFQQIKQTWESYENLLLMPEDQRPIGFRHENMMLFIESDHIWPPVPSAKAKVVPALCEVLSRLPEDVFDAVTSSFFFVLDDPTVDMLAVNVLVPASIDEEFEIGIIVVVRTAWKLSPIALVGLLAHEVAHSFVSGKDLIDDEAKVNAKVGEWGLGSELARQKSEVATPQDSDGKPPAQPQA